MPRSHDSQEPVKQPLNSKYWENTLIWYKIKDLKKCCKMIPKFDIYKNLLDKTEI